MQDYDRSPMDDLELSERVEEDSITFFVAGEPQPKGSTRSFYVKKLDRVVTTASNKNTKQWQLRVAMEAQRANESRDFSFFCSDKECAYEVEALFLFSRPKSLPKRVRMNTRRPDLDKLARALLDGLADILIPDDSQVTYLSLRKRYVSNGESPGARICVRRIR
ncbi:MAG: RusA family crossover junction endodeoxyribonuclease [Methanomassiliicoccales archaeon]